MRELTGSRARRGAPAVAVIVVAVTVGLAGCADSHFRANGVDAARVRAMVRDPFASFRAGTVSGRHFTCTTSTAEFVPASGEPLDFAGIHPNELRCVIDLPAGTVDISPLQAAATQLVDRAVSTGWAAVVRDGHLRFMKRLAGAWDEADVSVAGGELAVEVTAPPHTSAGFAPTRSELSSGQRCRSDAFAVKPPSACG